MGTCCSGGVAGKMVSVVMISDVMALICIFYSGVGFILFDWVVILPVI